MLYAVSPYNPLLKVPAVPKASATCPLCGAEMVPKCGSLNMWHWAHKTRKDCDDWTENEGAWHLGWKNLVDPSQCEVVIELGGKKHRADIVTPRGTVIELQNSAISPEMVRKREAFYGDMIWIFNAEPFKERFERSLTNGVILCRKAPPVIFKLYHWRWLHRRKSVLATNALRVFDFGYDDVLFVVLNKKKSYMAASQGFGVFIDKKEFVNHLRTGTPSSIFRLEDEPYLAYWGVARVKDYGADGLAPTSKYQCPLIMRTQKDYDMWQRRQEWHILWHEKEDPVISRLLANYNQEMSSQACVSSSGDSFCENALYCFDGNNEQFVVCQEKNVKHSSQNLASLPLKIEEEKT